MSDSIISLEDVEVQSRGRKKVIDADLAKALKSLKPNQAIRLEETFGKVPAGTPRQTVGQTIRKHWEHVRDDKPRIDFTNDGIPQVRVRVTKS